MNTSPSGIGPSTAELQQFIRDKKRIDFMLITGEKISGSLRWFDENAFSIAQKDLEPITLVRTAVVSYQLSTIQE
ncbi:MAG: hypothetical protein K2W82_02165 [Candidatus Obscuribacterales bacterium]|nr:hypothetical protein [Candidatus Obscuribacterales bacterium]